MTPSFNIENYKFDVPSHLIAQQPLTERDESKLFVYHPTKACSHSYFLRLAEELKPGSLLITNNTKVIPSRILATLESGATIEFLLLEEVISETEGTCKWRAIGKPLKKISKGMTVNLDDQITATVEPFQRTDLSEPESFEVLFNVSSPDFLNWLNENGYVPLPPYIHRDSPLPASRSTDSIRYQTVFADSPGSSAAPTAGLHFSKKTFELLALKKIEIRSVTLHVGAGTFLPIKESDIRRHNMHAERYNVPNQTLHAINDALREDRDIIAVGTTSLRSVESLYREAQLTGQNIVDLADRPRQTSLYIYPDETGALYKPWAFSGLLTNFHQPGSSLFVLVCALIGTEKARAFYEEALAAEYRFFSYGDASLLWLP